ncbi:hypothetical protein ACLSYX_04910 [[Pasteurella] aerogenes]
MNRVFKCKYDITSGVTKVVSELANNQQLTSQCQASSSISSSFSLPFRFTLLVLGLGMVNEGGG